MKRYVTLLVCLIAFICLGSGCTSVPVAEQRLVSRYNMVFSDSPVFSWQSTMLAQTEPGSASSGGAQAAGCTACQ